MKSFPTNALWALLGLNTGLVLCGAMIHDTKLITISSLSFLMLTVAIYIKENKNE